MQFFIAFILIQNYLQNGLFVQDNSKKLDCLRSTSIVSINDIFTHLYWKKKNNKINLHSKLMYLIKMIMIIVSNLRTEQCEKKYLHYRIRMEVDYNSFQFLLCCCCSVNASCLQMGPGITGDYPPRGLSTKFYFIFHVSE